MPVTVSKPGEPLQHTLSFALKEVASSPVREEIVRAVSQAFAAVLLIEGEAADENRRARQAIGDAIDQVREQMKAMPKTIPEPPVLLVLKAESFAREKVLLWSLGLEPTVANQARAIVLYGKARWMGPLIKGEEISRDNLAGILSIVGADCECGLDLGWTRGTRLPVRWDAKTHAQVAKALGFDPESPLVKVEAGRIIERGSPSKAESARNPGKLYSADNSSATLEDWVAAHPAKASGGARPIGQATALPVSGEAAPAGRKLLIAMAGMALIIVSAGLLVLARGTKRNRS